MAISSDPGHHSRKGKAGVLLARLGSPSRQHSNLPDQQDETGMMGQGTSSDMQTDFGMWHYDQGIAGQGFKAGWTAYMIEHQRGRQ